MIRRPMIVMAVAILSLLSTARAQVVINEVHGYGPGATPGLAGDYVELRNMSATPINLAGWTLALWSGDTGTVTTKIIPAGPANTWILGNDFYIVEEGGTLGDALTDSQIATCVQGMRMGTSPWSSSSSMGAYVLDGTGTCTDYVYLRRGTSSPPASPPYLPSGATWTLGNIATSGTGYGHICRISNSDTDSYTDWAQNATANQGTPGAVNTTGTATQTSLGAVVALYNVDLTLFGNVNAPSGSLVFNSSSGANILSNCFPLQRQIMAWDTLAMQVSGVAGMPFYLYFSPNGNVGHAVGYLNQTIDLGASTGGWCDVYRITTSAVTPGCGAGYVAYGTLDGSGLYNGAWALPGLTSTRHWFQAAVVDPAHPDGFHLTGMTGLEVFGMTTTPTGGLQYGPGVGGAIPDSDQSPGPGTILASAIKTPAGITIQDVNIGVDINHTWLGDVSIAIAFNGTTVILVNPGTPDSSNDLSGLYTFSDEGGSTFDSVAGGATSPIPVATYIGDAALSAFDGMDSGGTWTLSVYDNYQGDTGVVNSWYVILNDTP